MKISDTLSLFQRVEKEANSFYKSTLQVNFIHPLSLPNLSPDTALDPDFLNGLDQIASNANFRLTRHNILCSVINDMERDCMHPDLIDELKKFEQSYRPPNTRKHTVV